MALPNTIRFDNLLSAAKNYLTPDVVRKASVMTGESESATRQAMHGGMATMFSGLTSMASTPQGAATLGNLSREPAFGKLLNNVSSSFSGGNETSNLMNSGQGMLGKIFGDRTSGVTEAVARSSGISSSSSSKLMSMLAPMAIGVLGKHAAARGLNATGLANSLVEQRDEFAAAAPSGLSKLLGDRAPAPVGIHVAPDTEDAPAPVGIHVAPDTDVYKYETPAATTRTVERETGFREREAGFRWWPLLLLLIAIPLLFWLFRGMGGRAREAGRQAVSTTQNAATTAENAVSSITLPGGTNISVPTGSVNYNLARFLADGSQIPPHTFVFDHLNFETGSAQLTPDSQATVTSLSQILKAYPNAQTQLSGHTDNTGVPEGNQRLSLDRANTVKQMLVNSGIGADRITTNGYGQDRPIAPNDTEEGRARNRRLELTVTQK